MKYEKSGERKRGINRGSFWGIGSMKKRLPSHLTEIEPMMRTGVRAWGADPG
jgi:hypothetical protein